MTAVADLLADPQNFMDRNILIPGIYGPPRDSLNGAPIDMTLVSMPAVDGVAKQLGQSLGLYIVTVPSLVAGIVARGGVAGGANFKSYFCSYEPGQVFGTTVSNAADFMFTAAMDGCSLGVGMPAADGSRLVYHSNKGGDALKQQADLDAKLGANQAAVLAPGNYRLEQGMGHLCSTSFGVRAAATGQWSFYAQIYADDKGITNFGARKQLRTYFLREVKKFL